MFIFSCATAIGKREEENPYVQRLPLFWQPAEITPNLCEVYTQFTYLTILDLKRLSN